MEKSIEIDFSCATPKIFPMMRDVTSGILDFYNVWVASPRTSPPKRTPAIDIMKMGNLGNICNDSVYMIR